jgi:predicted naringenin-chalcone synthase
VNQIATAVPPHDVHSAFLAFARTLLTDRRSRVLFERMADKAQIDSRWSCLAPSATPERDAVDAGGFYSRGRFPSTAERMRVFERAAPGLAADAVRRLDLGNAAARVSHLIVTTCTGFFAPGLDFAIIERCGLRPSVERTIVGFMGCYAAINALKLARHIVRSQPDAHVLVVALELCTLHLNEADDLEQLLSFLLFGDGCAAALITAEPTGLALDSFRAVVIPDTAGLITWHIRELGFDMVLSGRVPGELQRGLRASAGTILGDGGRDGIELWAVHPGGRSILDAIEAALELPAAALAASRDVLRRFGNMSSSTVLFVLKELMQRARPGARGCAMAFGPGLTAETMLFHAGGTGRAGPGAGRAGHYDGAGHAGYEAEKADAEGGMR